jgi:hypothetical protein
LGAVKNRGVQKLPLFSTIGHLIKQIKLIKQILVQDFWGDSWMGVTCFPVFLNVPAWNIILKKYDPARICTMKSAG